MKNGKFNLKLWFDKLNEKNYKTLIIVYLYYLYVIDVYTYILSKLFHVWFWCLWQKYIYIIIYTKLDKFNSYYYLQNFYLTLHNPWLIFRRNNLKIK
jgi:hypothetical protein